MEALPEIERSADTLFRTVPGLAWIADAPVLSVSAHLEAVRAGTSWVVGDSARPDPWGFLCAESVGRTLHLCQLAVCRSHQRRGGGRLLVQAALDWARARHCVALTLTTFRDLGWNAPFYAALGFQVVDASRLGPRLRAILQAEVAQGLASHQRCAMQLSLVDDLLWQDVD
ncbi:GNAT family N-acetyltransferase [Marichromatium bheemlicum]|uniref:GNAT family N-acetyltransferase n=1 Tax=Marichromatium bheemlicum TaxID=365339 RepID=A0ABX1I3I0_9GAMM|nr:GNAT family N-acetyltransferase [Marichromatium bheemlicum]